MYAKTLFKPTRPQEIDDLIKRYTRLKAPHFFKYAKDKSDEQVEPINNSTVNRFDKLIDNPKFRWSATNVGKFDYKVLMKNSSVAMDSVIIDEYKELNRTKNRLFNEERDRKKKEWYVSKYIRKELVKDRDIYYVVDVLVKFLYTSNSQNKNTLWDSFGDIVIENIKNNVPKNTKLCEVCGKRFEYNKFDSKKVLCEICYKKKRRNDIKNNVKNMRKNRV